MKPTKPLLDRITKKMLLDLQKRKITNAAAAETLGVSENYLSRKVSAMQEKEPGKTTTHRKAVSALSAIRRQFREKLAKKVLKSRGKYTSADAAAEANCSERTMFRYVQAYRPAE